MGMKGTNGKTEYISKRIPRDSRREFQDMGLILMTSGISIYGHKRDKDGMLAQLYGHKTDKVSCHDESMGNLHIWALRQVSLHIMATTLAISKNCISLVYIVII